MRNVIKYKGKYLDQIKTVDRGSFVTRVYIDASLSNQKGSNLNLIGYGYCIQIPGYDTSSEIPAYGYGVVKHQSNKCTTTAELAGILQSLLDTNLNRNVEIVCDNANAVNIINYLSAGYNIRHFQVTTSMYELIEVLNHIINPTITARWVKGHSDNEYNHTANILARLARRTNGGTINTHMVSPTENNAIVSFRKQKKA